MSLTKNLEYTPRFDNKRIIDSKLNKSKTKYLIPTFFRDIIPLSENDDDYIRGNDHLVSDEDHRATIIKRVQSERIESMGNNEDDEY